MQYLNNGFEIQYRECQVLREAVSELIRQDAAEEISQVRLVEYIRLIGAEHKPKEPFCRSLIKFIPTMEEEDYIELMKFAMELVSRERGIRILKPYFCRNGKIIIVVNRHEHWADRAEIRQSEEDAGIF